MYQATITIHRGGPPGASDSIPTLFQVRDFAINAQNRYTRQRPL